MTIATAQSVNAIGFGIVLYAVYVFLSSNKEKLTKRLVLQRLYVSPTHHPFFIFLIFISPNLTCHKSGLHLLTQILIADITTLSYRGLVSSLTTLPFIINGFVGPVLSVWVLDNFNQNGEAWRWGCKSHSPFTLSFLHILTFYPHTDQTGCSQSSYHSAYYP